MTYPDDCVQALGAGGKWWEPQPDAQIHRGSLVLCYVPHIDQVPYTFEPIGRASPTEHDAAIVKVAPLKVDQPLKQLKLPVAAMPLHPNEVWAAYRAKRRPCVVLSCDHPAVDGTLTQGKPGHATAPMMLVAPFYGAAQKESRAGYRPEFIARVQHCYYPQFLVDWLPHDKGEQSILRLDQLRPVGQHHDSLKLCGFTLTADALILVNAWLDWMRSGSLPKDHLLADVVALLQDLG